MKNTLSILASLAALISLVTASDAVMESCRYGLRLCVELILPSLFPFFVVSGLLSRLGFPSWLGKKLAPLARRLFHVSGTGATALLLGLCGGYPMGAGYIATLLNAGAVTAREAERLLAFCNNTGPAFFLGALGGGVFRSPRLGARLYLAHIAAAVLTGLLLRPRETPSEPKAPPDVPALPFSRALPQAVGQAVTALVNVCGFVVCFAVFTGLLNANGFYAALSERLCRALPLQPQAVNALLTGFFELGGGIGALRGLEATPLHLAIAAAMVGWGGISVQFQTLALLADADVKSAPHTAGRFLSALFSFLITYGWALLRS